MTMRIDFYASRPHYAAHLAPIMGQVSSAVRGRAVGSGRAMWSDHRRVDPDSVLVVAAGVDAARHRGHPSPVVYVEHGAGQSYPGDPASATNFSYSGGDSLSHVDLFICPSQTVADRWLARYPNARTAVVGCARLDQHHPPTARIDGPPRVAFTFHWECKMIPETRSAWKHWREAVYEFARDSRGCQVVGHAHPRAPEILSGMQMGGIPILNDLDNVLRWCDVLVADNTSALFEACAIGKSTVVLHAPWYRRRVEHGLRFWSAVPGREISNPSHLAMEILNELADPSLFEDERAAAAVAAYGGLVDGRAAERAAAAIEKLAADFG